MHSSKNTIVAILLLGVSYGVYQVMTAPAPSLSVGEELSISEGDVAGSSGGQLSSGQAEPARPKSPLDFPISKPSLTQELGSSSQRESADVNRSAAADILPPSLSFDSPSTTSSLPSKQTNQPKQDYVTTPATSGSNDFGGFSSKPGEFNPASGGGSLGEAQTPGNDFSTSSNFPSTSMAPITPKTNPPSGSTEFAGSGNDATGAFPNLRQSMESMADPTPTKPLAEMWPVVESQVNAGQLREALRSLTPYCQERNLSEEEKTQLFTWLDALATKVVYSHEHHLQPVAYVVKPTDSLDTIAAQWNVPVQLIYNINKSKISNPIELAAGTELKQVSGPFQAVVECTQRELTLYVDGLYAGRFPITQCDPGLPAGDFEVTTKSARDQQHGDFTVMLNSGMPLHAEAEGAQGIAFQRKDAQDLFGILSVGSRVTIRR